MAVYKVIQDIEAEDKLLGPLTLKGFIYAVIAGVLAFLSARLAVAGTLGDFRWAIIVLMLPPILLFGLLAAPLGKEQPTEVWLLSHVQFFLKNRKRVWDQNGVSQTVIITAPKVAEKQLTKDLSQKEVKSRLKALAATLDTRGWAIKNSDVNLAASPIYTPVFGSDSQRLISSSALTQSAPDLDIYAKDDILDVNNNSTAQHFDQLMQEADAARRQAVQDRFSAARQQGQAIQSRTSNVQTTANSPGSLSMAEQAILDRIRDEQLKIKNHPHYTPKPSLAEERRERAKPKELAQKDITPPAQATARPAETTVTTAYTADKMELAKSSNAFSIASLSRLANRHEPTVDQISPSEVVVNLH